MGLGGIERQIQPDYQSRPEVTQAVEVISREMRCTVTPLGSFERVPAELETISTRPGGKAASSFDQAVYSSAPVTIEECSLLATYL